MNKKIIGLLVILLMLVSCGQQGDPLVSGIMSKQATTVSGQVTLDEEVTSAYVYIAGQSENKATVDQDGYYTLIVDMLVSGRVASAAADVEITKDYNLIVVTPQSDHGRTITILVTKGQDNTVPEITLSVVGSISGNVTLQGEADHSGILVYLPGTDFSTYTDVNGDYSISNVPEGIYGYLRAEKQGYGGILTADFTVLSGEDTAILPMMLAASVEPIGSISVLGGLDFSASATVMCTISASENATNMLISESADFAGSSWQPIEYEFEHTFSAEGNNTLYVKFADASGLESSAYSTGIYIETNPVATLVAPVATIANTLPTLIWADSIPLEGLTYHLQISEDASFTSMIDERIVADPTYTLVAPLDYLTDYFWRISIIDSKGQELGWSETWSFTVDMSAVVLLSPYNGTLSDDAFPIFTWQSVDYAASYILTVSTNADLSGGSEANVTETSSSSPLYMYPLPSVTILLLGSDRCGR